jgi:hypothetical protein
MEIPNVDSIPPYYAANALDLTVTEWSQLGLNSEEKFGNLGELELLESLTERATAMLWVRVVAILSLRQGGKTPFPDLSTSTICRTVLVKEKPWSAYAPSMTKDLLEQLKTFVRFILSGYNDTPYHCNEHAFHVLLSVNKLMDIMLQNKKTSTYGLRGDVYAQFAALFAALIHDVEHKGVPNRQLSIENDPLSILYNDQSIAENRSVFIAFNELMKPQYKELRSGLFGPEDVKSETYRRFRKIVVDLVLHTDIASAERTQISKSKWKEAFGDPFETVERKLKLQLNAGNRPEDEDSLSDTPDSSTRAEDDPEALSVSHTGSFDGVSVDIIVENDQIFTSKPFKRGVSRKVSIDYNNFKDFEKDAPHDYGITPMNVPKPADRQRPHPPHSLSMPMIRRSSLELLKTDEAYAAKFQRRMSTQSGTDVAARAEKFRKRLSICRSIDFSGEVIENYRRGSVATRCSTYTVNTGDFDEADELKAAVVLETIMTAADVAHNLQGYEQMVIWSGRLFLELRKAFVQGRGVNPEIRWFENQTGFLESYLLPLARRLEDTGVFGELGTEFASIVETNRDTWMTEGREVTESIIQMGRETFNKEILEEEKALENVSLPPQVEKVLSLVDEAHLNTADLTLLLQMLQKKIST